MGTVRKKRNIHYYNGVEMTNAFHLSKMIYRDVKSQNLTSNQWQRWKTKFKFTKNGNFKIKNRQFGTFLEGIQTGDNMLPIITQAYDASYVREAYDKFKEILEEHGAWEAYLVNLKDFRGRYMMDRFKTPENVLKYYLIATYERNDIINRSFCWSDTPQGHSFWSKLDRVVSQEISKILWNYSSKSTDF